MINRAVRACLFAVCSSFMLLPALQGRAEDAFDRVPHVKPRLVVLTDISNEPDDEESLVRLLVYADQFDIEGLVATTSTWLKKSPREDLIRRDVAAYGEVRSTLIKHAPGFPETSVLEKVTATGQADYGMAAVGEGKSTTGSKRIIEAVDRADERPVWISVWGGANTLAQALRDVRATRSAPEVERFVARMRVYSISDQDDAGPWIRREFPTLFYIVSPSNPDSLDYYRATWSGISGDRRYQNGVGHHFDMVDNPWLESHVIQNHGPLGALYPRLKYIMEGDTPSFLGLIDHGLGWEISPAYGGWGGRYVLYTAPGEPRAIWTDNARNRDTVTADNGRTDTSNQATIWRWREQYQNDFAARMTWCVAPDFKDANHNPNAVLNGDKTTDVLRMKAKGGTHVPLSAAGTDAGDDGQHVNVTWWIYAEAGTLSGATLSQASGLQTEVALPAATKAATLHVIMQAQDDGNPPLVSYRRMVFEVEP